MNTKYEYSYFVLNIFFSISSLTPWHAQYYNLQYKGISGAYCIGVAKVEFIFGNIIQAWILLSNSTTVSEFTTDTSNVKSLEKR